MFSTSAPNSGKEDQYKNNDFDSDWMQEMIAQRDQQLGMMIIQQDMIRHLREINNLEHNDEEGCSRLSGSLGNFILETESSVANGTRPIEDFLNDNAFYISPPKLDERASNIRFISSLDNELSNLEKVFLKLDLELKDNRIYRVKDLINTELDYNKNPEKFLMAFRERLDLLAIYKNALEFIPLKPPMEHYYVTSKYGKRKHPVTKKWRFHHGIDLAGTWQENIKVSADGVVTFAGYHGSFGKVIRIRHNYGIKTTYGHLAKILVKKGQIVSEGQVIGKMGRTGRVDGAHLHYEISVNGKSRDPAIYFSIGRKLLSRNSLKSIADLN